MALRSPVQAAHRTHKKENSSDSINSQRKRRFLSVVSCENLVLKQPPPPPAPIHHLRKISELKKQAMGEITNHQEPKGIQLRIKRTSAQQQEEKGVGERMVLFKKRLARLNDL